MRVLLVLIFSLNYFGAVYGQNTLSGKVVEARSGEPLSYANIIIKSKRSGTTTNVDGFFTLFGIPTDTSTIQFNSAILALRSKN